MFKLPGGWKINFQRDEEKKDFGKLNHLSPDLKIDIVRAQNLVDETRRRGHEKGVEVSLAYRLQLKNDCADMEKRIERIGSGKATPKEIKDFPNAILRLKTESENILDWKFENA